MGGAETKNEADEGVRVFVNVEGRRVLSAAAVEVEQTKLVPSKREHTYKSAIWLVKE
jgi:hypothetical protein